MQNPNNINNLHSQICELILEARATVSRTVNYVVWVQNLEIGRMIVEEEQGGEAKAEYKEYVIKDLSKKLITEFGSIFSITNLKYYRQFYLAFPISHSLRDQLNGNSHALRDQINDIDNEQLEKSAAVRHKSKNIDNQIIVNSATLWYKSKIKF